MTWELHPRNPDLKRTLDPLSRWSELVLVERFNVPDTWVLRGPADSLDPLTDPGMGLIVNCDGVQRTTGQAGKPRRFMEDGREFLEIGFASDLADFGARTVLPDPAKVLTATAAPIGAVYDRRVGTREDLILAYVSAHLGPTAQVSRRLSGLVLPASLGRGGTTTVEARLDTLGVLVQDLAEAARLRVTVEHDESLGSAQPRLALRLTEVPDVSANVRFGPAGSTGTGRILSYSVDWEKPSCTAAIVVAGGEGEARLALMLVNADAEAMWRRRWEQVIDQRQTADQVVMTDAAQKALDEGAGFVNIALEVADSPDVVAGRDYGVGYRVGTDLPDLPDALADNTVREFITTVRNVPGEPAQSVRVVVGTPDASAQQTKSARKVTQTLRRVAAVERSR